MPQPYPRTLPNDRPVAPVRILSRRRPQIHQITKHRGQAGDRQRRTGCGNAKTDRSAALFPNRTGQHSGGYRHCTKDEVQRRIRRESRPRSAPHRCHHNNCHHQQQRIVEYTAPPARIATLLLLGCLRRVLRSFPDQIIRRHTEVRADGAQLVKVGRRVAPFTYLKILVSQSIFPINL